ncbi:MULTISPECIES: hypothetical protein [Shinella]|uniref:TnsA endonuclease-like protein n=1 Tax=Shinella sumterensis TaxID=1967501 RepID=A0AA50CP43_9HYPH|nr:hypothetical protein [Shinella sumterensis]WLR97841.1 hypothetical protein Q9313_02085 [Shinella sumterensis]
MRHTHKISKYIKMKRVGLGSLAFPSSLSNDGACSSGTGSNESYERTPFVEPSPARATRKPALKQAKTNRGHSVFGNIVVYHESGLEQRVSSLLRTYRNIKTLMSQYPRVEYFDDEGIRHQHTFDYFVELTDGTRIGVAVKPSRKRDEMKDLLKRIRDNGITGVGTGGRRTTAVVDAIILVTEHEATYDLFENTYFILMSRSHHDDAEVRQLRNVLEKMPGQVRFGHLLLDCSSRRTRRTAIWRLIDLGFLQPVNLGRIDELSWLRAAQ